MANEFKKNDAGKARWDLMPEAALAEVLKVLEVGAQFYGPRNWAENHQDVKWSRYLNALERHLKKFKRGQDFDEETGLDELAHMAANVLFLLTYRLKGLGVDDRWKDV